MLQEDLQAPDPAEAHNRADCRASSTRRQGTAALGTTAATAVPSEHLLPTMPSTFPWYIRNLADLEVQSPPELPSANKPDARQTILISEVIDVGIPPGRNTN